MIPSTLPVSSQVAIADDEAEILTADAESALTANAPLGGQVGGPVGGDGTSGGGGGERLGEAEGAAGVEVARGGEESDYSDESELGDINDEAEGVKGERFYDFTYVTYGSLSY